ncbi:MAG: beta-ketoacyl synthase N-terminal-like domain-containing protein [Verrucomicrobiota bacterium]|jgi:3-oxoacyl-[acyl-carrier-protein] synthase II
MARRVVITGIGPVTSAGIGTAEFFKNLWNRQLPVRPIPAEFTRCYAFHSRWYIPQPEVTLADFQLDLAHESIMHPEDRMVVLGGKLALEDAGYRVVRQGAGLAVEGLKDGSVVLGTGFSNLETAFASYLSHCLPGEVLGAVFAERRPVFSRLVIPKTMPNSPAAWASICLGLTGSCHTVNASCASGTYALGEAFRRIKDGYDEVVLSGGVESVRERCGAIMRGFDALGVLTQSPDGRPGPFGKKRSGFLFAEGGACLLLLEELDHALGRRAPIYAEVADYRANSDACNIMQIDPEGTQITRLLRALAAGRKIDYLNAHGTGTVANDEVEARAIRTVFGGRERQPWINSTKGLLGHTLGASGAIEAAVAALAVARGAVHGNLTADPMDGLNLPLESVEVPVACALSVSYGFGGHNGGLVLTRIPGGRHEAAQVQESRSEMRQPLAKPTALETSRMASPSPQPSAQARRVGTSVRGSGGRIPTLPPIPLYPRAARLSAAPEGQQDSSPGQGPSRSGRDPGAPGPWVKWKKESPPSHALRAHGRGDGGRASARARGRCQDAPGSGYAPSRDFPTPCVSP